MFCRRLALAGAERCRYDVCARWGNQRIRAPPGPQCCKQAQDKSTANFGIIRCAVSGGVWLAGWSGADRGGAVLVAVQRDLASVPASPSA
jgi:hypothetical protein